jgi:hypothetical protein
VTFADAAVGTSAIAAMNGAELDGRVLNVNEAQDRGQRAGGSRGGGDRW